jgi:phosphate transport system permease protein
MALLTGLAALLEIRSERKENHTKDSPIVTENMVKLGLRFSAIIASVIVMVMVIYVVILASPFISVQLFTSGNFNQLAVSEVCQGVPITVPIGGALDYALGSLLLVAVTEFAAIPLGVLAAIYLAEYSSENRFINVIRFFIETLAGTPSVVMALIGYAIFTVTLGWSYSLIGTAIALSFMALPWNIRIAEGAMRSVPKAYKEASFGLGATQWQTARLVTLYAALPGIITGVLLGIGVALGETLILLRNYGNDAYLTMPKNIFATRTSGFPSLTGFVNNAGGSVFWMGHGNGTAPIFYSYCLAFSVALVLIMIYLVICIGALLLRNYLNKRMRGS